MSDVTTLSDSVLDAAYAACFDNRDFNAANIYGFEIADRLMGVSSFVSGASALPFFGGIFRIGVIRFPKYDARQTAKARADVGLDGTGFQQVSAAQSSIADNAGNLANDIGNSLKIGGIGVLLLGAVALGVFVFLNKK